MNLQREKIQRALKLLLSSNGKLFDTQVSSLEGWAITNLDGPEIVFLSNGLEVEVEQISVLNEEEAMYWIAPEPYLGNKVSKISFLE